MFSPWKMARAVVVAAAAVRLALPIQAQEINPYDQSVHGTIPVATRGDVEEAIHAAGGSATIAPNSLQSNSPSAQTDSATAVIGRLQLP